MRSLRPVVLSLSALGSCSPDEGLDLPPLEFESARARVGVSSLASHPLYTADLAHIDQRIETIETLVGVHRDTPVEIYLEHPEPPCGEFLACYFDEEDVVFTNWQSVDHEIVHAVTREIAFPSLFWEEGAAELLSGGITRRDETTTLRPKDLSANTLTNYLSAGHFARFLVETRGWPQYRRVIRAESIEAVYGQSTSSLVEEYEAEAPYSYPSLEPCPFVELESVEEGSWHESMRISPDAQGATQFEWRIRSATSGPAVFRRLELAGGTYAFELEGGVGFIMSGCHTSALLERPDPPSNGDLYNEVDYAGGGATEFPGVGLHVLSLTEGTYWLSIPGLRQDEVTVELAVTRVD